MSNTLVFVIAFLVSYLGSIPPGTINVTTMQLAVQNNRRAAVFFGLAAALVEFVYAGATVRFQLFLSENPVFTENFQIISAIAMILLGIANLVSKTSSRSFMAAANVKGRNGFKKGIVLGILNPLTIPFWLAMTAYLQTNGWISISGAAFWFYLAGISVGTFVLLLTVIKLGQQFTTIADNQFLVHKVPGLAFLCLGLYNLIGWYF